MLRKREHEEEEGSCIKATFSSHLSLSLTDYGKFLKVMRLGFCIVFEDYWRCWNSNNPLTFTLSAALSLSLFQSQWAFVKVDKSLTPSSYIYIGMCM